MAEKYRAFLEEESRTPGPPPAVTAFLDPGQGSRVPARVWTDYLNKPPENRQPQLREPERETPADVDQGFLEGFGKTALFELGPGLIGFEEPESVRAFKRDHPIAAFGALLTGAAAPYGLAAKFGLHGASKIPLLRRAVGYATDAERVADAPGITRMVQEAVRFAPFEAGRVGLAAAFGPPGAAKEVAQEALFDTAAFGTFGLVAGKIGGIKASPNLKKEGLIFDKFGPDYPINASPQTRLEAIQTILRTNTEESLGEGMLDQLYQARAQLAREVATQTPPGVRAYVQRLAGGVSASGLNRLFKGARADMRRIKLTTKPEKEGGLGSIEEIRKRLSRLKGITDPDEFWPHAQYPTLLRADTPHASEGLRRFLRENMTRVDDAMGDNAFIAREAEGIWVMAQRIKGRTLQGHQGDEFLIWKTNKPGLFHPAAERMGHNLSRTAFHFDPLADMAKLASSNERARFIFNLQRMMRSMELTGVTANKATELLERALKPEINALRREGVEGVRFVKQQLKQVVSPSLLEFSESPNAVAMMSVIRAAYARAQSKATAVYFGKRGKSEAKSIFGEIFGSTPRTGGLDPGVKALTQEELVQYQDALIRRLSPAQARSEGMGRNTVHLLRKLQKVHKHYSEELATIREATNRPIPTPLSDHFMEASSWSGGYRMRLYERLPDGTAGNELVAVASGKRPASAKEEAEQIIEKMKEKGFDLISKDKDPVLLGRDEDLRLAAEVIQSNMAAEARAVRSGLLKAPEGATIAPSHKAVREAIYGNVIESERTITDSLLRHMMHGDIHRLKEGNPTLGRQLELRLQAFAGEKGRVAKGIDKAADAILAPIFGKNSASEIVRIANRAMFDLTLGALDLGFATMNAMTPIQTVLPEVAYLLTAPVTRLAKYYGQGLVLGKDGGIHKVAFLEPLRIMRLGLKSLAKPTAEERRAFSWGIENGHLDPKFVEEFFGETSELVKNWGSVLKGEAGFLEWGKALTEFLPAKSEQFSRAYSFMVGRHIGKDFFKLSGDELLNFAAQFTGRTNYLYSTADRARIITGAVGSLFGLFKNWGMHYTGNFMIYAGEGLARGNFAPLMWGSAGTAAVGGLGALPLYGAANQISRWLSDKSLTEFAYEGFGYGEGGVEDNLLDSLFYGFPALGGVTLQGRAAPTGNEIMRDLNFLTSSAVLDRAAALSEGLGGALDHYRTTGQHPIRNQQVRDRFAVGLLPRTLYRALQFTEDGALRSLNTGNRLYSHVSIPQRLQFIFGFAPLDFEKAFEVSNEMFSKQKVRRETTTAFGQALADAEMKKDWPAMMDLYKRAVLADVDLGGLGRSWDAVMNKRMGDVLERQFDLYEVYKARQRMGLPVLP